LNPERMEYLTAMNREDTQMGVESMGRAREERYEDMAKGLGYFGTGNELRMQPYNDINTLFGYGAAAEKQGYAPFNMGSTLGTNAMKGDAAMAQMYGQGVAGQYDAGQAGVGMFTNLLGQGANSRAGGMVMDKVMGLFG
jgi:hypothetical protein